MCTKCLRDWIDATDRATMESDPPITLTDMAALTERLEHCAHGATPPRPSVLPPSLSDEDLAKIAYSAWVNPGDSITRWIAVAMAVRAALKGEK